MYYKFSFKKFNDFSCHSFFMVLTFFQSIGVVKSILLILLISNLLLSRLNCFNKESNRAFPRSLFPITQKGLLKIIEKMHPWNESVKTISASIKARSHLVGDGITWSLSFSPLEIVPFDIFAG